MKGVVAGIDVAAKTLQACVLSAESKPKLLEFANTPAGHQQAIAAARKLGVSKVVCEATGIYHLDLAFALVAAELPVMVANPRQIKSFMQARLRNTKTDSVDAHEIAQFGLRMDFQPWTAPSPAAYALLRIARAMHTYTHQATAAKNRLHAAEAVAETPKIILKTLAKELANYERFLSDLSAEALEVIASDAVLARQYELLLGVPGIARTSAIALLGELGVLSKDLSAKAWIKLAGLDPRLEQSGTSVNRKTRISRNGNSHLRGAGFMPAMCARTHDPGLKAFADRLVKNGKTKLQAIVAVERKLLHGIHAMFRQDKAWNSTLLVPNQA